MLVFSLYHDIAEKITWVDTHIAFPTRFVSKDLTRRIHWVDCKICNTISVVWLCRCIRPTVTITTFPLEIYFSANKGIWACLIKKSEKKRKEVLKLLCFFVKKTICSIKQIKEIFQRKEKKCLYALCPFAKKLTCKLGSREKKQRKKSSKNEPRRIVCKVSLSLSDWADLKRNCQYLAFAK